MTDCGLIEREFWLDKWRQGDTPFHNDVAHAVLLRYWSALGVDARAHVLVPLCGKSADLGWLRTQGHRVLGVELSEIACRDFFIEHDIAYNERVVGKFRRFCAERLTLLAGDFFDLGGEQTRSVEAVYDRAALVALPGTLRRRYAERLCELLPPAAKMLVITVDYPQSAMAGPPFAVASCELSDLFAHRFELTLLDERDIIDTQQRFRAWGLNALIERVFLLTP